MKNLILILIFNFLICLSNETCTQRYCGSLNAQCSSNSGGGGKLNELSCLPNYYCGSNNRCEESKLIKKHCNSTNECELGLECLYQGEFKICKPVNYLGNGEKCDSTDQCLGSLQCTSLINGDVKRCNLKSYNCSFNEDCKSYQYCNFENQCVNKLQRGSSCEFNKDQCTFDCICSKDDTDSSDGKHYLNGKCLSLFNKNIGESCFSQYGECNQKDGLYCPSINGYISTCQRIQDHNKLKNCTSDSNNNNNQSCDAFWQKCECDGTINNSTCHFKFNIDQTCSNLYFDYQSCLSGHFCQINQDIAKNGNAHNQLFENSCVMKYCQQEALCFFQRCLISEFGGCLFPDYLTCKRQDIFSDFQLKSRIGNYTDGFGDDFINIDSLSSSNISSTDNNNHHNNNHSSNSHSKETNNNNSSTPLSSSFFITTMMIMFLISLF